MNTETLTQNERTILQWLAAKHRSGVHTLEVDEVPHDCPIKDHEELYPIFRSFDQRNFIRWTSHDDMIEILPAAVAAADELNRGPDYLAKWTDAIRRNRFGALLLVGVIAAPIVVQWFCWIRQAVTSLLAPP